jgi:hypothetical protein
LHRIQNDLRSDSWHAPIVYLNDNIVKNYLYDVLAWSADVPGTPDKYLAVFNLADDEPAEIAVSWKELGLNGKCAVRDLWQKKSLGLFEDRFAPVVKPHAAGLYRIVPAR